MMKKFFLVVSLSIICVIVLISIKRAINEDFDGKGVMTTPQAIHLITNKGYPCLHCHAIETKIVGPAYQEVAHRYKGNLEAKQMLKEKVKQGGMGHWGEVVPMPPHPMVTETDLTYLIEWILSL